MKTIDIGGVILGPDRMPAICVPIAAGSIVEIMHRASEIADSPADFVEFRADWLDDTAYLNSNTVDAALKTIRNILPERPVLFTLRTSQEGGKADVRDDQYAEITEAAAGSGFISAIDLEYSRESVADGSLQAAAAANGIKTVVSFHDFEKTPPADELVARMKAMAGSGADIVKAAVMPQSDADLLEVLKASEELKRTLETPFILISMGEKGVLSRVSGGQLGSAFTFASAGWTSAPGQMDADTTDRILRALYTASRPQQKKFRMEKGNIVLGGFMGTGKSSVSRKISMFADFKPVDMDKIIEERAGMKIPEIFKKKGEEAFRDMETEICGELSEQSGLVISTGGGTLLRQENVDALRKNGVIFMLEANPDTIYGRLKNSIEKRPKLEGHMNRGYISWLMKRRQDAYDRAADAHICVDGSTPGKTAVKILSIAGIIPD
ncbi:MAG: type I 3-dehydroquinate dehydratase [Anaerovoracaceae bacterium]|jgi:3-dehydroquinate dehydratase type I